MKKNYIFFFFYLLTRPKLFLLFLKKVFPPIYIQFEWLKKYNVKTFIDIGANEGKVSSVIHTLFPSATIYAFEPLPTEFNILKKTLSSPHIILNNIALSDSVGNAVFYENNLGPYSSLLKVSKAGEEFQPLIHDFKEITVDQTTLDEYFKDINLEGIVVMKMDAQGVEHLILKGAEKTLKKVDIIHVEIMFSSFYENQCLFSDLHNILSKEGFEYVGSAKDSEFYPSFVPSINENSIFINKKCKKFYD